ncbi:MAG: hypothetical protein HOH66_14445 [Rhodospirillaceae bacterium]|jgi:hypothetical protein|nr:hypothetical protein [Rhodospirillaceae bacterium]MBT6119059.1 hypothetical protein [Rhodospirillaceae bacterium]
MAAAITLFIVLSLVVFIVQLGAAALRQTGLPNAMSRFQALSAFTGTGFTTSAAEAVVNNSSRRHIVSILMIVGNVGLVSILSTVVVSLTHAGREGDFWDQAGWHLVVLVLIWVLALNPRADRLIYNAIGALLRRTAFFEERGPHVLLQLPGGTGVYSVTAPEGAADTVGDRVPEGVQALGLRRQDGTYVDRPGGKETVSAFDELILYGPDRVLSKL